MNDELPLDPPLDPIDPELEPEPMFNFVTFNADGRVRFVYKNMTAEEMVLNTGEEDTAFVFTDEPELSWSDTWIDDGEAKERPKTQSTNLSGAAPFQLDLSKYAAGSSATIANQDGETLDIADMSAEISLVDAGIYRVSVSQPFPHKELSYEVTVT